MDIGLFNNITIAERTVRAILGFAFLYDFFTSAIIPMQFAVFTLISLYLLFTALVAWDPLFAIINALLSPFKLGDSVHRKDPTAYA